MARIAGIEIPDNKQVLYSIVYIYGIGHSNALKIIQQAGIEKSALVKDLKETDLVKIRSIIDSDYIVEGDLRREIKSNVQRLIDINSYRGNRHRRGLPVRGQRTKTNSRTRRTGPRATVAGKRRVGRK
ncbi:MAG: 30S ribosomal protein S13 [Dehalococcoidia bacterium]|jgi:small subunit ribosomal protein S13|nr:MAG: small subunit ribosomal protein S13 [Chloroflexota bacterium]